MSYLVTCAHCREAVLEADLLGDEEECVLRDHLLAVHPKTVRAETCAVLLRHFVLSESPPLATSSRVGSAGDSRRPGGRSGPLYFGHGMLVASRRCGQTLRSVER